VPRVCMPLGAWIECRIVHVQKTKRSTSALISTRAACHVEPSPVFFFLDLQCPAFFTDWAPSVPCPTLELPNGSIRVVNQPPSEAAMRALIKWRSLFAQCIHTSWPKAR
jgi:hypothetical protein